MSRYINPVPFINDGNGHPIPNAKLFFFHPGTTTEKTIYSDSNLSIAATNPQLADASGRYTGDIFLDGLYDVIQQDASGSLTGFDGVTLWGPKLSGDVSEGQLELWVSTNIYNIPEIALGSDDEYYRSLSDANQGNDPTVSASNWEQLRFGRIWNANITYAIGESVYGSDGFLYLSRTNSNVGNNPTTGTTNWRPGAEVQFTKGADIASASAFPPGSDGNYFDVTGTTTITSIDSVGVGAILKLHFDAALTLTHHATDLILPGGANITTAAGDEAEFYEYASGDWRCTNYQRASGLSILRFPGSHIQSVSASKLTVVNCSAQIPFDDTIPQNTEGNEVVTVSITPTDSSNQLIIEYTGWGTDASGATNISAALFQDSTANALQAISDYSGASGRSISQKLSYKMAAGTTSEITFKIRCGPSGTGSFYVNGDNTSSRVFGGISGAILTVREVKA